MTSLWQDLGLDYLQRSDKIASIVDGTDALISMERARILFKNGHSISIIRGLYSYGGDIGLFEIMPSDSSFLDEEGQENSPVCGYLTADRVHYYITKIGSMSA